MPSSLQVLHPSSCQCGCRGGTRPPSACCAQCGQNPCRCFDSRRLLECFSEIEQFKRFIREIMGQCGPPCASGPFPLRGVTDGKPAAQGDVGEFVQNSVTGAFTAAFQSQSVNAIILQPGDWDVSANILFAGAAGAVLAMTGALAYLSPLPSGVSGNMYVINPHSQTAPALATNPIADTNGWFDLEIPRAQVNVSVPTLLAFQLQTNLTAAASAGIFTFTTTARRMR